MPTYAETVAEGIKTGDTKSYLASFNVDGEGATLSDTVIPVGGRLPLTVSDGISISDLMGQTYFSFAQDNDAMATGDGTTSSVNSPSQCFEYAAADAAFGMYTAVERCD